MDFTAVPGERDMESGVSLELTPGQAVRAWLTVTMALLGLAVLLSLFSP